MLDERLDLALQALSDGIIDPVQFRSKGPLFYVGW
jgi:hypothetical protein